MRLGAAKTGKGIGEIAGCMQRGSNGSRAIEVQQSTTYMRRTALLNRLR